MSKIVSNLASNTMSDIISDIQLDTVPETTPLPPWMFNLEGIFLGFLGDNPSKVESIVMEVEQEQITIQLPRNLCAAVQRAVQQKSLQPGDHLRCIGRSRLDYATSTFYLKGYCIFIESASSAIAKDETVSLPQPSKQKQGKILVCHNSGCKKRGGRRLVTTLKQTLDTYDLHNQVEIQYTGCQKRCSKAPNLTIVPGNHHYDRFSLDNLPTIIEKHFCTA